MYNNNIEKELQYYIDSENTDGALLITGPWGCGKSYFIKQFSDKINKANNRKAVVVTVSMFGVDSVESLKNEIGKNILSKILNNNDNKIKSSISNIIEKAKNFTSTLGESNDTAKTINALLNLNIFDYVDLSYALKCIGNNEDYKLILIFDDFERCSLDIITRMGLINNYVENRGTKVIIVADEENIESEFYKQYKLFKEKLITKTYKLNCNDNELISAVIYSVCNDSSVDYGKFIVDNTKYISRIFIDSITNNLRLLKSFLIDFKRVYDLWPEDVDKDFTLLSVMRCFEILFFENRTGHFVKLNNTYSYVDDKGEPLYRYVLENKYFYFDSLYELDCLDKWIIDFEWDDSEFWKEVRNKFLDEKEDSTARFLSTNIYEMQQEDFEFEFEHALYQSYLGKLPCEQLLALLHRIKYLEDSCIEPPCNIDYSRIKIGLESRKSQLNNNNTEFRRSSLMYDKNDIVTAASDIYDEICSIKALFFQKQIQNDLIEYFKNRIENQKLNIQIPQYSLCCIDDSFIDQFWEIYINTSNQYKYELIDFWTVINLSIEEQYKIQTLTSLEKLKMLLSQKKSDNPKLLENSLHNKFISIVDKIIDERNLRN